MDNVRFHKTHSVQQVFIQIESYCLFKAPYTPQLNPIECMFGILKRNMQMRESAGITLSSEQIKEIMVDVSGNS